VVVTFLTNRIDGLKIPKSYILDARFTLRHCAIKQDSSNWASTLFAKRVWLGCSINDFGIQSEGIRWCRDLVDCRSLGQLVDTRVRLSAVKIALALQLAG